MNACNKKEMAERFRLYGEIFMLCVDMFGPYIDDSMTYHVDELDFLNANVDCSFMVETNDECGEFNGLDFEDGMLMVNYARILAVPFFQVKSDSLKKILEALTKYKEV